MWLSSSQDIKGWKKELRERRLEGGCWMSDAKGTIKYCGWNVEGMKHVNELCQQVNITELPFQILT